MVKDKEVLYSACLQNKTKKKNKTKKQKNVLICYRSTIFLAKKKKRVVNL